LANELLKAIALINDLSGFAMPPGRLTSWVRRATARGLKLDQTPD